MKINIYTDGSSRGNPGPGGWGCILIVESQKSIKSKSENLKYDEVIELGGREENTTNNRMELLAAIKGLQEVSGSQFQVSSENPLETKNLKLETIELCTDSEYVKKGITEWIDGWIKNGWKTSNKKPVLNQNLWESLKKECDRLENDGIKIIWKYVPGHSGVPLNERADRIATACADNENIELYRGNKADYNFEV